VELGRQRRQLERTNRLEAWSEVARQVAHDIKNPLTPIQLNAEHLKRVHTDRGGPMGPVVDGCVDTILGQVRLLRAIASEFSNFASTPAVKCEPVPVSTLVDALVEPYLDALAGAVTFVRTVPDGLPEVGVDRALTARALANLLENALQATGQRGTVAVGAEREPGPDGQPGVAITIADSGPGMDPAALARAFEPYFSTKAGGTGLGLPIAKRNIEASGGTVRMTSEAGAGTRVVVWLPAVVGA
jgi:two-component system nitrogen regulation sensor histidine kinase NtrY